MIDYFSWRWSFFLLARSALAVRYWRVAQSQAAAPAAAVARRARRLLGAALLFAITNAGISLRSAHSADRQWLDEDAFGAFFSLAWRLPNT